MGVNNHISEGLSGLFAHDCVLFDSSGSDARPPVRIFVGTEDGQWRAERVLLWSIEQVRDPSRVYEVHLMKNLPGFRDRRWLTGFTNYRFVIPHLTGGSGRAIYNDVDQIYLRDPAELFDLEMNGHGVLTINPRDTSVMLIDTQKMAPIWTLERARRERRKRMDRRASQAALQGPLDSAWNARDTEYRAGESKLVHFTTIHTQPWMPFPGKFVYQHNSVGDLWFELERSADAAGFSVFSESRPSVPYQRRVAALRMSGSAAAGPASDDEVADREQALAGAGAASVLECGLGVLDAPTEALRELSGRTVARYDPVAGPFNKKPAEGFDAVVFTGGLEVVPDADLAWLIDGLFRHARHVVHVTIRDDAEHPDGARVGWRRDRFFWSQQFEAVAAKHPDVDWRIVATRGQGDRRRVVWARGRGRRPGRNPAVWVLVEDKTGHTTQSLGLADALGWPYETRRIGVNPLNRISNRLLGATRIAVGPGRSDPLEPPWPDLVISTGRRTAPVARWIAKQGDGHPRTVLLGRKGADIVDAIDLALTCSHFRLLPHPRRMETIAPINGINDSVLEAARTRWRQLRPATAPGPIVLLAGGSSAHHQLNPAAARRLGRDVVELAAGREVLAITSPRTGAAAAAALAEGLGDGGQLRLFEEGGEENPYLGYLALADAIVATGESESMLGEAVAAGVPVYIYPLARKPVSLNQRFGEWVRRRAYARPLKRGKGSVRPQTGLEALCAGALAHGIVRIHRDLDEFHRSLVQSGVARMFGAPLETGRRCPLREVDAAVSRVRAMLSLPPASAKPEAPALGTGPEVSSRVASAESASQLGAA